MTGTRSIRVVRRSLHLVVFFESECAIDALLSRPIVSLGRLTSRTAVQFRLELMIMNVAARVVITYLERGTFP